MIITTYSKGSSILEVLIATALISLSILAALSLNNYSHKTNTNANSLSSASNYNNQVIEWLRNLRTEMGWGEISAAITADNGGNPTYCLPTLPANATDFTNLTHGLCSSTDYIPNSNLIRQATLNLNLSSNILYITVTTSWDDQAHSTSTEATITNW